MTLAFLGERQEEEVRLALAVGAWIQVPRFELVLDRIDRWPNGIVWMGCSKAPWELGALAHALATGLEDAGFRVAEPPFFPHVTLMRRSRGRLEGLATEPIVWSVAGFALMESQRLQSGAQYRELQVWPLT